MVMKDDFKTRCLYIFQKCKDMSQVADLIQTIYDTGFKDGKLTGLETAEDILNPQTGNLTPKKMKDITFETIKKITKGGF